MIDDLLRNHRGFRLITARTIHAGETIIVAVATHRTTRAITLWHGPSGPATLPAGTYVNVVDEHDGITRFRYAGLPAGEVAIADSDAFEPSDTPPNVPDIE